MLPGFLQRKNKPLWYKALKKIHLWLGLGLCVPLVLIGLTGSILVFEHEIDDAINPTRIITEGAKHSASEIIKAAQAVAKDGFIPIMIRNPTEEGQPATVRFAAKDAKGNIGGQQVAVNPATLEIVDEDVVPTVFRTILQLHSALLLREYNGRTIVGWLGVVMLFFGLSGLIMWWPKPGKLKEAFTFKLGSRGLRLHRDLHGAVGIWGLAVFITVSFSGVYLAFPKQIGGMLQVRDLRAEPKIQNSSNTEAIDIDRAITLAQNEVEGSQYTMARIPAKAGQPYRISLVEPGYEEGAPQISVFISQSGEIAEVRNPANYSKSETFVAWQHAIHAGHGFGWVWKILVFASGFLPVLFSITGIYIWLIKRKARMQAVDKSTQSSLVAQKGAVYADDTQGDYEPKRDVA